MIPFSDRTAVGKLLARHLAPYRNTRTLVLGIARGGIEVASSLAHALSVPFDCLVIKKIPSPANSELAIGAVAPGNITFIDKEITRHLRVDSAYIEAKITDLTSLIAEKIRLYREGLHARTVKDKVVILTDDGIATGATFETAVMWCKARGAKKIIGAVPVAPPDVSRHLILIMDELIVLEKPEDFQAVGQYYVNFSQLTDTEVIRLLRQDGQEAKM